MKSTHETNRHFPQLTHPLVQDLCWAVSGPGLLHEINLPAILPAHLQQKWAAENLDWFVALDQQPESLENWMASLKTKRLGHRFEAFIHYFFAHVPTIELLGHSMQLYANGITLGELDFVIRYDKVVYHIEVAVKYYCRHDKGLHMSDWIGPDAKDRLNQKWEHLLHKQLPLGKHADITHLLQTEIDQHLCWMQGKVFLPDALPMPDFLNPQAETGRFFRISGFGTAIPQATDFYILDKPYWLSDLWLPSDRLKMINRESIAQLFQENGQFLNALHVGYTEHEHYQTAFLVADDWPHHRNNPD